LEMRSQKLFALSNLKPWVILPISASQVARITGMSHRYLTNVFLFCFTCLYF
jgi:hypothetical protein